MKRLFFFVIFSFTVSYTQTVSYDTIQVNAGWNLVGPLDYGAVVNTIATIPPAIIISPFYQYSGQYLASDTLTRGKGYWVKLSEPGIIILQIMGDPCDSVLTVYHQGKTYNTIAIGPQCWLRENLDVGTMIIGTQNQTNNGVIEKYCYDNDSVNCIKYGGLYQWNEAMQYTTTPGTQGICPTGWHIPTSFLVTPPFTDFQTLKEAVNNDGNALRIVGEGGTNSSGFSALMSGYRGLNGTFWALGYNAEIWSSTENDPGMIFKMYLNGNLIHLSSLNSAAIGFSVRCIKD